MVQIEELQSSTRAAAPGWSYVVDTGYDPSKVAINPSSRKRLRTGQPDSSSDLTLRQQTAIQRHLAELDKDSHKEVIIPVPKSIFTNRKQTTNAKRVLGSGKTFQHYLEEEEARLALKGPATAPADDNTQSSSAARPPTSTQRPSKTPIARRKAALATSTPTSTSAESTPGPAAKPSSSSSSAAASQPAPAPASVSKPPVAPAPKPVFQPGTILAQPVLPSLSEAEISALLSVPELSYSESRVGPPPQTTAKHRTFCEICGYWGRVRCNKCGARVCGLECRDLHDESRCLKFYA